MNRYYASILVEQESNYKTKTEKEVGIQHDNFTDLSFWHGICYIVVTNISKFNYNKNEKRIITN